MPIKSKDQRRIAQISGIQTRQTEQAEGKLRFIQRHGQAVGDAQQSVAAGLAIPGKNLIAVGSEITVFAERPQGDLFSGE